MEPVVEPRASADDDSDAGDVVTCVWCGSTKVERLGEYGPGLMTGQWMCRSCHSPFEWIRKR